MDAIIKRRREEIENTPLDEPLPSDLLTSIITANTPRDINYDKIDDKEVMRPMNDHEIRVIIFDGIIAGTDTTANTISFIVYYLAHHPDVKRKMLNEIDRIFQDDKTRPITENDVHNLKYCEAIVKEVSRIFSVVHVFSRCLEKPDEIGGYQWPAETMIKISVDAIHHNEEYWDEPDKFNPDRWMVEELENIIKVRVDDELRRIRERDEEVSHRVQEELFRQRVTLVLRFAPDNKYIDDS
ncbi:unnamed protein product [Rhizophagus irregularis]|nr:unnamed protein product [Rhizophagus irregularis]